ncbi:MAG: 5'-nucleotidase C-terminal domain-containing protein [Deltaproteobacteria bacterium]|nr:5'-nucleotidase C-terminal domain-containing protein [Deltaproteobacteria bacterium]
MKKLRSIFLFITFLTILFLAPAQAREVSLRILYVNDFHGFAEPYKPVGSQESLGGVSYLAAEVNKLRKEKPALLLAAGDMIQGHSWANLFRGKSSIALMNLMRFDAMVVGNHEFDFGQDVLKKRIAEARFPVLGANVEGFKDGLKPYVIKEIQGMKVAIIGVVTPDTPQATHPKNVAGLKFLPPAEVVEKYLPALKKQADLIIVLSHIGYQADRDLAARAPGIGVIVGGHSHTKLLEPTVINQTIIVQAWEHAKALGVLDLTVEDGKLKSFQGRLEMIKAGQMQEDKAVRRLVKRYGMRVNAVLGEKIGEAALDLDGEHVRMRETNLGDFLADILRQAAGADAAIINGGGIRTSILKGNITVKDIYAVLPFDNYLVAIKLTGKQIREALEHGVSGVEEGAGRFPQVSGLSFTFSRKAPAGSRVKEVLIGGHPLDPQKEYVVATNDFMAAGGDGYQVFGEALKSSPDFANVGGMLKGEKLVYNDAGRWLREVVIDYMRNQKKVAPQVDGRIKEMD